MACTPVKRLVKHMRTFKWRFLKDELKLMRGSNLELKELARAALEGDTRVRKPTVMVGTSVFCAFCVAVE